MPEEVVEAGPDLRTYLRVLSRRKIVIAATTLVLVALAVAYVVVKTPAYTASAQVLVPQQSATSALNPSNDQLQNAAVNLQRDLSDDQQFAEGAAVTGAAQRTLGIKVPVTVTASSTADVLSFTATSIVPAQAAKIANAYAHAYIAQQRASQVGEYTSQVHSLDASIAQIRARISTDGPTAKASDRQTILTLTQSLQDLQAASNLAVTSSGTVINAATTPTSPSSPHRIRDGLLGLVVGLILGIGLAFAVDRLDDTIKSFADVEEQTSNLPVLGTIPLVDKWRRKDQPHLALREDATSPVSESYRTLRTAVQFVSLDEPKHVIGITSALPDEGKSTAVANLALSFARAGQRVIVVSFDFRKPRLHSFFGLTNDAGVTSVLLGRHTLKEAIKTVEGEPYLRVLPAGPIPPNPAEILALNHVVDLVDSLSESAQIVLLDCPPVLPVTDTLLVSRLVDGMLVLTRAGKTRKQDLRRTVELLRQVQAPLLGVIVNSVPHRGGYAYEYGYGYGYSGYGYGAADTAKAAAESVGSGPASFDLSSEPTSSNGAPSESDVGTHRNGSPGSDAAIDVLHTARNGGSSAGEGSSKPKK